MNHVENGVEFSLLIPLYTNRIKDQGLKPSNLIIQEINSELVPVKSLKIDQKYLLVRIESARRDLVFDDLQENFQGCCYTGNGRTLV